MERITRKDLDQALAAHVTALESVGIKYDGRLVLSIGSKYYGNAYRLNRIPEGETGHWNPPVGGDFLGMTAREAYDRLTERTRTIYDTARAIREGMGKGWVYVD